MIDHTNPPGTVGYAHDMGMRLLRIVIWLKEEGRGSITHNVDVLEVLDDGLLGDRPDLKEHSPTVRGGNGNVSYDRIYLTLDDAETGKQREIAEFRRGWEAQTPS